MNYLCLPLNPKYDKYKDGHQPAGYVYGSEYEVNGFNPLKKNVHDYEAVCAVCFTKSRGSMHGMIVHLAGPRSIMGT